LDELTSLSDHGKGIGKMSYSRNRFADELDGFLHESSGMVDCTKIADWAYKVRLDNLGAMDPDIDKWLLQLGAMSMGEEFKFSGLELQVMVDRARAL
jgi:hypothetical protein